VLRGGADLFRHSNKEQRNTTFYLFSVLKRQVGNAISLKTVGKFSYIQRFFAK
jgi:hypothetical protein